MFRRETRLEHFAENDQPAAQRLDQRPGGLVDERWCRRRRRLRPARAAEQKDASAQAKEGLDLREELFLDADRANRDQILRFHELRPRQQILSPGGFDGRVRQIQHSHRLTQECRLSGLGLHHRQIERRHGELERDCGRPAARSDVEHAWPRTKLWAV